MPLPGTPHCAKISLRFTFGTDGQVCENIFHVRDMDDSIFANPAVSLAAWNASAYGDLLPHLYPSISLIGMGFEDIRTFPFGGTTITSTPGVGAKSGGVGKLPSSVSLAIKKNTANLGRSGRGRWYWPLGDAAALSPTNDTVLAAYVAEILTAIQNFKTDVEVGTASCEFGVVSYRNGGVQRSVGLFQPVIGFSVSDAYVDSQRRRLTGRGR